MTRLLLLILTLLLFTACQNNKTIATPSTTTITIPDRSSQLIVVTTENWNKKEGTLQRYEKINKDWKKVGDPITIILGRNGLGWGVGLHTTPSSATYIKKEGDGRAPAGLFTLGHGFGYAPYPIKFPYTVYKRTDHCVDDSNSKWYNQIVDSNKIQKDYKSFEHMKLNNHEYKYGITVEHNKEQIAHAGSCIFIHIRNQDGKGTAGCTAMSEGAIMSILNWLQKDRNPLLLQLPKEELSKITF